MNRDHDISHFEYSDSTRARILVVDDNSESLAFLVALLDPAYQVLAAKSGERALQLATAAPQPDLILLDMIMPEMDGYMAISRLKANPLTRSIPVLFVTAKDRDEDERRGLALGAVDYIVKPLRPEIILARIHTHLELKRAKDMLAHRNDMLEHEVVARANEIQSILRSTREGIFGTNDRGLITFINPAANKMLGYAHDELLGQHSNVVFDHSGSIDSSHPIQESLDLGNHASEELICDREGAFRHQDGRALPVEFSRMPLQRNGMFAGSVVTFKDISERKRHLDELERKSNYDDLTGLPNHRLLAERLEEALGRCRRENVTLSVLLVKLGHLKEINDTLGRNVGDMVLKNAAHALTNVIPGQDTFARLIGDEFVVVHLGPENSAAELAHNIIHRSSLGLLVADRLLYISAHVGISIFPRDGESAELLHKNAAAALKSARSALQDTFRFFDREMNADALKRLDTVNELRHAIERKELVVFYQPQVSLHSGEINGCEALVRWQHPQRGLVAPGEFIDIAEDTGMIIPIGEWVLRSASEQCKKWHASGLSAIPVAVNISPRQLATQDLTSLLKAVLAKVELDPSLMELELTETAVMTDVDAFISAARGLKKLDVSLAIDDFGTGFSSLNHLKRLPLDRVKIDISFIRDVIQDANSATIVRAIISLAHSLNLSVLAEGVETGAQLDFLRAANCDDIQGYYFSRPVPAEEFELLMREQRKLDMSPCADVENRALLIVDDDPGVLASFKRLLRGRGYEILHANSGAAALELLATHRVQVVISDARMPQMSGTEFLRRACHMYPDTIRIMLSGYTDLRAVTEAVNSGELFKFITKPLDEHEILSVIADAFRAHERKQRRQSH